MRRDEIEEISKRLIEIQMVIIVNKIMAHKWGRVGYGGNECLVAL